MVRAKFTVTEIKDAGWGENWPGVKNITLFPVGGSAGGESEENKAFYAATPGGFITLSVVNAAAAEQFTVGQEFYVDFTPADRPGEA
jgi:hypothetical protein